jgi:hypothetical protein
MATNAAPDEPFSATPFPHPVSLSGGGPRRKQ